MSGWGLWWSESKREKKKSEIERQREKWQATKYYQIPDLLKIAEQILNSFDWWIGHNKIKIFDMVENWQKFFVVVDDDDYDDKYK